MDASTPYHFNDDADVVLQSSDNVYFHVIGPLLRFVSPVFKDIFLVNRGSAVARNEQRNGLPVIPFKDEDSETLRLILDFFYPFVEEPQLTNISLLWKVGKAAQKYIVDVVEGKLKNQTLRSDLIKAEPLRIYAVAIDLGWEDVANKSAHHTLKTPLEKLAYVEELRSINGSGFYRLLEYRLRYDMSTNKEAEKLMKLPNDVVPDPSGSQPSADLPVDTSESFKACLNADLIIRSSDSIDFLVIGAIIRQLSPRFDSMFPLESPEVQDGRPIVPVEHDSKVLCQLLGIIYHQWDAIDAQDVELFKAIIGVVREYQMTTIERKLRKQALDSPLLMSEPLRLYILATTLDWDDVAKAAALNTLSQPLKEMGYLKELSSITGADLYRLVHFRFRCAEAARNCINSDQAFCNYGPGQWNNYWYTSSYHGYRTNPQPSEDPLDKIKACPRGSTMNGIYASELEKLANYGRSIGDMRCNMVISTFCGIMNCWSNIGKTIEEAVSKVISVAIMFGGVY